MRAGRVLRARMGRRGGGIERDVGEGGEAGAAVEEVVGGERVRRVMTGAVGVGGSAAAAEGRGAGSTARGGVKRTLIGLDEPEDERGRSAWTSLGE